MQDTTVTLLSTDPSDANGRAAPSAISWPSIFGGALAITALSIVFVTFGGAVGLTPHPMTGHAGAEMTAFAAIWLVVTQWVAGGVGGYLAGRMRSKWAAVHTHEVFFRDTVHGFLAWALALLVGAVLLSTIFASMLGHAHGPMMAEGQHGMPMADNNAADYYVDSLYRGGNPMPASAAMTPPPAATQETASGGAESVSVAGTEPAPIATPPAVTPPAAGLPQPAARIDPELRAETIRILMRGLGHGMTDGDKNYLAQQVAARTGLSSGDAAARVDGVMVQMQADLHKMGKSVAYVSIFTGLSMLIGAFIAAAAAAFGGSQRDEWEEAVRSGSYRG